MTKQIWYQKLWKREKLLILIILSVVLGLLVGLLINKPIHELNEPERSTALIFIGFPGEILMRMLKMMILPLIVTSLIIGLAELDQKSSGRLGRRAVVYYLLTTFIAVALGIILAVSIQPGSRSGEPNLKVKDNVRTRTMDTILDLLRNMFPDNMIQACFQQIQTPALEVRTKTQHYYAINSTNSSDYYENILVHNSTHNISITTKTIFLAGKPVYKPGTNILGIVAFSIVFGIVLGQLGDKGKEFVHWIGILNDIILQLVTYVMWYSPIGLWSLITARFASMTDISGTFENLGYYIGTVVAGLAIHAIIVLPTIYFVVVRKNPLLYIKGIIQALLTAFGTSSSSATLPVTFKCLEERNKIDRRVSRFVLPIGATINMDGTALYEAVAAIFIAQSTGFQLTASQYIVISLTATLASIGAAGIPQAGLITMLMVLQTVGLPEEGVTLIIAVDWFLDRIRTTVNVLGDCIGAGIVDHLSVEDLQNVSALKEFNEEIASVKKMSTVSCGSIIVNGSADAERIENLNASTTAL